MAILSRVYQFLKKNLDLERLCFILALVLVFIGFSSFLDQPKIDAQSRYVAFEVGVPIRAQGEIQAVKTPLIYSRPSTQQVSANNYEINLSGETVSIGSATNNFTPVIRFNRFGGESYVELNLVGGGSTTRFTTSTLVDGIITADNNWFTLQYSSVDLKPLYNELGGVDMKLTLKRAPPINSITFTYNHQKANAYLQPPLTAQEIADGATRPDYVVNSIAFYGDASQVNNSYKTGKIGQLYAMKATDALGSSVWTSWGFGSGQSQLTLSIDATWLANAVYPVVIAPVGDTFGYTSAGATRTADMITKAWGAKYASGGDGTATSISFIGFTTAVGAIKLCLYDVSYNLLDLVDKSLPNTGWGVETTFTGDLDDGDLVSNGTTYYLVMSFTDANIGAQIYLDTTGGISSTDIDSASSYANMPENPWTPSGIDASEWKLSIYCTYTPGGVPPATSVTFTNTTSSAAGNWTNPSGAFASGGDYAYIVSSNPSSQEVYSGYNFTYEGDIVSLVTKYSAWCAGSNDTYSQYKYPTSDSTNDGKPTWLGVWTRTPTVGYSPNTNTSRIDDWKYGYGFTNNTNLVTLTTATGGYSLFGFGNFSVPNNATSISLNVSYMAMDGGAATNLRTAIKVGNLVYGGVDAGADAGAAMNQKSFTYSTNPKTGGNWTAADINGYGTNFLCGIGINSTDSNPNIQTSWIGAVVTWLQLTQNEAVRVKASWDGGYTWTPYQTTSVDGSNTLYSYNITSYTTWTPTKLNNTNFRVWIDAVTNGTASETRLDWIPVEVTYVPLVAVLAESPSSFNFGGVATNSTYYAKSGKRVPLFPLVNGNCTFLVTNNGGTTISVKTRAYSWSGGVGWTLVTSQPSVDEARLILYRSGDTLVNAHNLTHAEQTWLTNFTAGNTTYFDLRLDTATIFSDFVYKETYVILTGIP